MISPLGNKECNAMFIVERKSAQLHVLTDAASMTIIKEKLKSDMLLGPKTNARTR